MNKEDIMREVAARIRDEDECNKCPSEIKDCEVCSNWIAPGTL